MLHLCLGISRPSTFTIVTILSVQVRGIKNSIGRVHSCAATTTIHLQIDICLLNIIDLFPSGSHDLFLSVSIFCLAASAWRWVKQSFCSLIPPPPRHWAMSGYIFVCHDWEGRFATGILWVESRDAGKHLINSAASFLASPRKELSSPEWKRCQGWESLV